MMIFSFYWQANDESGARKSGKLRTISEGRARGMLRKQGLRTIVIVRRTFILAGLLNQRAKRANIIAFVRALKTMSAAGMLISEALAILAQQENDKELAATLFLLKDDVVGGVPFSQAITSYPSVFDPFFVSLASAGESSGKLPIALERIAAQMGKNAKLAKKIKTAMSYPLAVLGVASGLIFIMLIYVIPTFQEMFGTMPLPLPTQILLTISTGAQRYWLPSLLTIACIIIVLLAAATTTRGKLLIDAAILRLPFWGTLVKKDTAAQVARAMALMTASGMLAFDALNTATNTINNSFIKKRLQKATMGIMAGKSIAEPMRETGIFSPMAIGLIAVGETTKSLGDVLGIIADFYDDEITASAETISEMLEPVMTVVIGLLVGGMLLAMYLPIFGVIAAATP